MRQGGGLGWGGALPGGWKQLNIEERQKKERENGAFGGGLWMWL